MDHSVNSFLSSALLKRTEQNTLRSLSINNGLVDFCSNDYLGFARSPKLKKLTEQFAPPFEKLNGSTGSRLLSGNTALSEYTEKLVAKFHHAPAGLIYNSGYDANIGLFSCIAQRGDTFIYDEFVHASIHDGIRLSSAESFMFRHNNLEHLEQRLKHAKGNIFVAVESVYSMDGDVAPLKQVVQLCKKYRANVILDEAHATGVIGKNGKGLACKLKLEKQLFARVHTFGKALGCHGAIVLGNELLKDYLVNFSRSFIYTTALPPDSLYRILCAYRLLAKEKKAIHQLEYMVTSFRKSIRHSGLIESNSPIQSIIIKGNTEVKQLAAKAQKAGFDVRPILSPTVPKGKERLRICLHTFNTKKEIEGLAAIINKN